MADGQPADGKPEPARGIPCPRCGGRLAVVYTRAHPGKIVRRRECIQCRKRMTTTERATG
ncbi:MAG: NrdR family transcriptional regulator [Isosphaeraceae bacterium]